MVTQELLCYYLYFITRENSAMETGTDWLKATQIAEAELSYKPHLPSVRTTLSSGNVMMSEADRPTFHLKLLAQ